MRRKFKGIWIPKKVWLERSLKPVEKLMLVEIDSLDVGEHGCYASNQYFADFFDLSRPRITAIVAKLVSMGFISVNIVKQGNRVLRREIKVLPNPIWDDGDSGQQPDHWNDVGDQETDSVGGQEADKGWSGNEQDNNTKSSNKNKSNKGEAFSLRVMIAEKPDYVSEEALRDYLEFRTKKGLTVTRLVWNKLLKQMGLLQGRGFSVDDCLLKAQMSGWRGFESEWFKEEQAAPVAAQPAQPLDAPLHELINLYHECCPSLARVSLNGYLAVNLSMRWQQDPDMLGWRYLFEHCERKFGSEGTVNWKGTQKRPYLDLMVSEELFETL